MTERSFQFGTVGVPLSTPKKPGGSVGAIARLAELGLKAYEMGWVRSVRVSNETCKKIKETAEDFRISLSVHAPYYINMNARKDEWPNARKRLIDAAHYGDLAGASNVIFHPGSYFDQDWDAVLDRIRERLAGCIEELREVGNSIMLRPETMGKAGLIGSISEVLDICEGIDGAEPCIDFAHLHSRPGNGSMNTYEEWCDILDEYADRLDQGALQRLTCHLSGVDYNSKGEIQHVAMLESDFNLPALLEALIEKGCKGRILNESPLREEDALYFKKVWTEISGERYGQNEN